MTSPFPADPTHLFTVFYRYCLVPRGAAPGVSVGHTCTYIPSQGGKGRIVIVGGANPNGSFSDSYIINLGNLKAAVCTTLRMNAAMTLTSKMISLLKVVSRQR